MTRKRVFDAHRPEQSDYAPEQPAVPRPETSPTPKSRWPSWTYTETVSTKQADTDTAMKAIPEQTFPATDLGANKK